jgi:hypothetical protein
MFLLLIFLISWIIKGASYKPRGDWIMELALTDGYVWILMFVVCFLSVVTPTDIYIFNI